MFPGPGVLCVGLLLCCFLSARNAPAGVSGVFEIGPELSSFHYREPGPMREDGLLYGGFANFTAAFNSNLVWNLDLTLAAGTLRYDGQTMDGEPVAVDTPDWLADLRTALGWRWAPLTPFAGLGLRYWRDDLGAHSPAGYTRETFYLYTPLGLEISRTFGGAWTLGARAEFDVFWAGLNRNTDFPLAEHTPLDFRQSSGYGARASVFLQHPVTRALGLTLEPFLQYWDVGESERKTVLAPDGIYVLAEPANRTTQFGLRGGLCW